MGTNDKNIVTKPIEDWAGVYLYRTVEELATNDFQYSPKRDLARAELHGKRLEKVMGTALASINSLVQDAQVADKLNNQILPELARLDIQSAKALVLQQISSMPSSKVQERISTLISYIHWLKARGSTIDPGDEAFLHLDTDQQEAFLRQGLKQVVEVYFDQLWYLFLVALVTMGKGEVSFEQLPVKEACYFLPWRLTLDVLPLASDSTIATKLLCPENRAAVEDREATRGWGGDSNKAFEFLDGALGVDLQLRLNIKGWHIPGTRYSGIDNWDKPTNDEPELLQIGLWNGLVSTRAQNLLELLAKGSTGELHNYFAKASENRLKQEIRRENRRRGIKVPPKGSLEGKTEDEIRKQVDEHHRALLGREVLDYELKSESGSLNILDQASDRQAFREWSEAEVEAQRGALVSEKVREFTSGVKLTPRQKLVVNLFDKPNEIIATALYKRFGKLVAPGAVRKLRYDLLRKLKEIAQKK
jgi:hypothetical protein